MENNTDNYETQRLISLLVNRALNGPNDPADEKIVLPDECGDSLWDEVLGQDRNACAIKKETDKKQTDG